MDRDRAQVGEQAEPAAQGEERLLGPDRRSRVVPLRPADRAEEDGIGRGAGIDVVGPDRHAVGVDPGSAHDELRPFEREAEGRPGRFEHAPPGCQHVRPDAVARDRRQAVGGPGPIGARGHGRSSTTRGVTKAGSIPLISAPWSLLTATR